jgi:tRNA-dihydrouridine synthase A
LLEDWKAKSGVDRAARSGLSGVGPLNWLSFNPWWLSQWDAAFYRAGSTDLTCDQVEEQMVTYMERAAVEHGTPWPGIARHMLGLRRGLAGARHWRQVWSDHKLKEFSPRQVMVQAHAPDCCAI